MKAELVLGNLKREREALEGKLERLNTALCKDWEDETQEYLCTQQYNAMSLYAHILDERIIDIEYKLEQKKKRQNESSHEACHNCTDSFKKDIDSEVYKKYRNDNCCKDEESEEDDPVTIIIDLVDDIFDILK